MGAERSCQGEQYSGKGKEKQTPSTGRGDDEPSTSGKRVGGPVDNVMCVAPATSSSAHLQGRETAHDLRSVETELSQPNPSGDSRVQLPHVISSLANHHTISSEAVLCLYPGDIA